MKRISYKLVTLAEVRSILDLSKPVMFDTETIGLYGKIRLAQFYQRHMDVDGIAIVYMVENPNIYELIQLLGEAHIVGHNIHYDISTIQENLGIVCWKPKDFDDTFLLSRLYYYTKEFFSLDKVIEYVIGEDVYGGTKSEYHKANWNVPVLSDGQLSYAAKDVAYLQDVWETVSTSIDDINYRLDKLCLGYCLDFQNNGLPVDMDKLNDQYAKNLAKIQELNLPINCNSYQQVRPYINSTMSDDLGLATLSLQGNEKAAKVREVRKLTKQNSFLEKFSQTVSRGRIFGKFKPNARSGRTTSDDQNLQQLPRKLKGIFGLPEDGDLVLLYSDFAQMQLRNVCAITADKNMERLFRLGEDLHNFVAKFIFGESFTKTQRQICKTANFSLLFGAGIEVFKAILIKDADLLISDKEASDIRTKWLKLWKEITDWQNKGIKDWRKKVAWETPLGRKYTAKMMTDQLAMQIQGFEAEVAKLAMHYMIPRLAEVDTEIKLCNFIHDSFIFVCPNNKDTYEAASKIIGDCMQEAWVQMSQSVTVTDLPMPVKVRVGWNWGDIENDIYIYEYAA